MAGQSKQKNKLLVLKEIFEQQTDENHPLSVQDIINKLAERRISCERKTVYNDIATLTDSGMDIVISKQGHSNVYYLANRLFQTEELFVLADAVASCRFLTIKKSNELITKIQSLTNKHEAPQLSRSIFVGSRTKAFNEGIYYSINTIHDAIHQKKKITFKYTEYDADKKKKLRHDGYTYRVSPFYLAWEEDNYYLVCYCEKHEGIARYRVDRMESVKQIDDPRDELSIDEEAVAKAQRSVYSMYGGTEKSVTIEFDKKLMNVIIDRFGTKVISKKIDEDTIQITVDVQISPPFWGWLFTFGTKAKIISPPELVAEARKKLEEISAQYLPKPKNTYT